MHKIPRRQAAGAGEEDVAVRVPEPDRERTRPGREQPRLHVAVLGGRPGPRLRADRPAAARGGRDRGRRADRRDGLGGAEQHRCQPGPQRGDRGQRQRAVLRADDRRAGRPAGLAAAAAGLRAGAGGRQADAGPHTGGRWAGLRRAARAEGRDQGRVEPAGAVLRPRPQVLRADRRARHRGDGVGAAPGPALRRPGDRARGHPQGQRLPAGRERRGRADALARRLRPGDRPAHPRRHRSLDQRVRRGDGRARGRARTWWRITAAMLGPTGWPRSPQTYPAAASTSGSPSSTRSPRPPGWRPRCTRCRGVLDVPEPGLRPAADGRGPARPAVTRCSTGRRDRNDGPSHNGCGTVTAGSRARDAGGRAARAAPCARSWPRPSRCTTVRPRSGSRRAP